MASRAAKAVVVVVIAVAAYLYLKSRSSSKSPYAPYYLNDDGSYYVDSDATYGEPPAVVIDGAFASELPDGEAFPAYLYYPPGTPIQVGNGVAMGDLRDKVIALSPGTTATLGQLQTFNDEVGSWLSCARIAPVAEHGKGQSFYDPVGIVGAGNDDPGSIMFGNGILVPTPEVKENYEAGVYGNRSGYVLKYLEKAYGYAGQDLPAPGSGVVLMATDPNDPNKLVPLTTTKPVYQTSTTSPSQPFGTTSIPAQTTQQTAAQQRAATTVSQVYATQVITPLPSGVTKIGGTGSAGGGTAPKTKQSSAGRVTSGNYGPKGSATGVSMSSGLVGW